MTEETVSAAIRKIYEFCNALNGRMDNVVEMIRVINMKLTTIEQFLARQFAPKTFKDFVNTE